MTLIKTYRRDDDGVLHYLEAWADRGSFVTRRGKAGTKGSNVRRAIRDRTFATSPTLKEHSAAFHERAANEGYREVPIEEHAWVVLQVWTHTADLSHPDDTRVHAEAMDVLDEHLGWQGVGHCDGTDLGGKPPEGSGADGTVLNLFCRVIDARLGVAAVRRVARQLKLTQRYVIGVRDPGEDAEYELAYSPRKRDTVFQL